MAYLLILWILCLSSDRIPITSEISTHFNLKNPGTKKFGLDVLHKELQSFKEYLRQTLVFMWNSAMRQWFNFSFSVVWLVMKNLSLWRQGWALVYHSSKFWDFPGFCLFPKIQSLKSFNNSSGNSDTPCLLLIIALCFTCGERKIW